MAGLHERAWGNYVAMMEFLLNGGNGAEAFNEQRGLIQMFSFASLLTYSDDAERFNEFLLLNAVNFATPGNANVDNGDDTTARTRVQYSLKLSDAYEALLNVLDVLLEDSIDPVSKPEYQVYLKRISAARRELDSHNSYVNSRWREWRRDNPSFPETELYSERIIWERDNGYSMDRTQLRRSLKTAQVSRNAWLRRHTPAAVQEIIKARTYFDDENHLLKLPIAPAHEERRHLWQPFHMQLPTVSIQDFLRGTDKIEETFKSESRDYSRVETHWKVKAKAKWGIFSGGGSSERRKLEEISKSSTFESTVSAVRLQEVDIFRSQWFQPVLFETVGREFEEFWGPGGMLATYPVSLIICRGLKVKVDVDAKYKRTLEKLFKAGGRASFGPFFSGGGSYSSNKKFMKYRMTQKGFELFDDPTTVRLLGCRVRRPNWQGNADKVTGLSEEKLTDAASFLV